MYFTKLLAEKVLTMHKLRRSESWSSVRSDGIAFDNGVELLILEK